MEIKIFLFLIIIISAVFHEFAHGFVAYRLGDPTAKDAGRLTLNPLAHIEIFGTILLPVILLLTSGIFIGWAKPVPYNPLRLRDRKYGSLKVGLAGPGANLVIAVLLGVLVRILIQTEFASTIFIELLSLIVYINISLALFNLIPMPPLDGSKVVADLFPRYWQYFAQIGSLGIFLALIVSFLVLPDITQFLFRLIVGRVNGF